LSESAFLLDSNVWVALAFEKHPAHLTARDAFTNASPTRPACFCRATQQSFLRLASTPAIFRSYGISAMTNDDVLRSFELFTSLDTVAFRDEPSGLAALWPRLAARSTASPKVWIDAYLAAFAITGGLTMVTADHDFEGFKPGGLDLFLIETAK
jgi:uncharacterized protein